MLIKAAQVKGLVQALSKLAGIESGATKNLTGYGQAYAHGVSSININLNRNMGNTNYGVIVQAWLEDGSNLPTSELRIALKEPDNVVIELAGEFEATTVVVYTIP